MLDVRVHATIAQQAQKMQLPFPPTLHGLLEQWHLLQLVIRDHQVDARDVHVHDAARADIQMADFTVAHLAFGQADGRSGRLNQGIRKFPQQFVVGWLAREGDGISLCIGTIAPPIEYRQHHWFRSFSHGRFSSLESFPVFNRGLRRSGRFYSVSVISQQIRGAQPAGGPLPRRGCSAPVRCAASRLSIPHRGVRSGSRRSNCHPR